MAFEIRKKEAQFQLVSLVLYTCPLVRPVGMSLTSNQNKTKNTHTYTHTRHEPKSLSVYKSIFLKKVLKKEVPKYALYIYAYYIYIHYIYINMHYIYLSIYTHTHTVLFGTVFSSNF